jgi:hypothetical protein
MELITSIAPVTHAGKRVVLTATIHLTKAERAELMSLPPTAASVLNYMLVPQRFNNGTAIYVRDLIGQQRTIVFSNRTLAKSIENLMRRNGAGLAPELPPTKVSRVASAAA